jgi:hypothetical protein
MSECGTFAGTGVALLKASSKKKGMRMENKETVETTLGDLIVALTEETVPFVRDEKEAYKIVAHILLHVLPIASSPSKVWQGWH